MKHPNLQASICELQCESLHIKLPRPAAMAPWALAAKPPSALLSTRWARVSVGRNDGRHSVRGHLGVASELAQLAASEFLGVNDALQRGALHGQQPPACPSQPEAALGSDHTRLPRQGAKIDVTPTY